MAGYVPGSAGTGNVAGPAAPGAGVGAYSPQAQQYYQMLDANNFQSQMANSPYAQAFQTALGNARGNIQQQLGTALGDIANSQRAAGAALGQLPGQLNVAFDQANTTNSNAQGAIGHSAQAAGLASPNLAAYMAPEQAALNTSREMYQANVPLLQQGINQQTDRERAMANMAAQSDNQKLDEMQMQNQMQQAQAYQQYQFQQRLQDDPNRNFGPSAANTPGSQPVIDKNGTPQGYTPDEVKQAMASPKYQRLASYLMQYAKDPARQAQIWHELNGMESGNPALLAALKSNVFNGGTAPNDPGPMQNADNSYFGYDASNVPFVGAGLKALIGTNPGAWYLKNR